MRRLLLLLILLGLSSALAVSYTVQVAALGDQAAARALLDSLRQQGFPAYLVGVPTESGQVYRLRVGAFANRAAAMRYGERMAAVTGLTPVPALAEDMPILPLEPSLVASFPYRPGMLAEVVELAEGLALRVQNPGREAEYRLLAPGAHARAIAAWRLLPLGSGGFVRVYSFPLWPEGYEALTPEARREEERARLAAVAQSAGLTAAALEAYVARPQDAPPVLVRAERWDEGGAVERYPAFGDPRSGRMSGEGPSLAWPRGAAPADLHDPPAPLAVLRDPPQPQAVQGEGWQAQDDGDFTRLQSEDREWRALAGRPLWAAGDYLLALGEGELLLYWLSAPP